MDSRVRVRPAVSASILIQHSVPALDNVPMVPPADLSFRVTLVVWQNAANTA